MVSANPTLEWYADLSQTKGLPPRCPFASVHRCPRYYQSVWLLGNAGNTEIPPDDGKALLKKWQKSDLWPVVAEQEASTLGSGGIVRHYWNFCPEVSFDNFGLFASSLHCYPDEIDIDLAHAKLGKEGADADDWRWIWCQISAMHYSECPIYSPLAHKSAQTESSLSNEGDILELKPNFFWISINLNALIRRLRKRFRN